MPSPIPPYLRRPEILDYVISAYAGTDNGSDGSDARPRRRRVFLWEDGTDVKMGNTQAFALHLRDRFGLINVQPGDLHALLRELGETVQVHKQHAPRIGKDSGFAQPEPDEWIVGQVTKEAPPIEPE